MTMIEKSLCLKVK